MRLKGVKTAVVALLLAFQGPVVWATEADSLRTDSERFAWQQFVAPTVLFSAGAAYWLLPAERRLFALENKDLSLLAVPYTDGRSTGLSLAMRF